MRRINILLGAMLLIMAAGCYKDKGNYTYTPPEEPIVTNLDTVYNVLIGDTLVIKPTVQYSKPADLTFNWKIAVPEMLGDVSYEGPQVKALYGLGATRYNARLTITNNGNGMKYFYNFIVSGQTAFSKGTLVLSEQGSKSVLTFIKPDGSLVHDIYEGTNNGESLPGKPKQLIGIRHSFIAPSDITSYWVFTGEGAEKGVQIDANNMKKLKPLSGNFFTAPATIVPGKMENSQQGVLMGTVNGKLYVGTSQTWNLNPIYGMFGLPAEGDYNLFGEAIFNSVMPYFLGYDKTRKQVVGFTNFGSPAYIGTGYQVEGTAFDPRNVGLDFLHYTQVNNGNCFAFGKDATGAIVEAKFGVEFRGVVVLKPQYKRNFKQPELITTNTQWTSTPSEIFYFSSGSKIYRYNPINEDLVPLITDFGGKAVTMVKVINGGTTLLAGTEGAFYYLDINTGKFGDIIKKIEGIPGATVDVVTRNI